MEKRNINYWTNIAQSAKTLSIGLKITLKHFVFAIKNKNITQTSNYIT